LALKALDMRLSTKSPANEIATTPASTSTRPDTSVIFDAEENNTPSAAAVSNVVDLNLKN
jgi:hypothetical protein